MKLFSRTALLAVTAIVSLVLIVVSFWTPVQAQLGNTGVPVTCYGNSTPAGSFHTLTCIAADGTAFVNNEVPAGYYLHITDLVISPGGGLSGGLIEIVSHDASNTIKGAVGFQTNSLASQSHHFTSPVLVLPAQHRVRVISIVDTCYVYAIGLLTRNVTFIPFIAR